MLECKGRGLDRDGEAMKKNILSRLFFLLLGLGFLFAIGHIGRAYFHGFTVEYGFDVNCFGPDEGAFYLIYGLAAFAAILFIALAMKGFLFPAWSKIRWTAVRFDRLAIILALAVAATAVLLRLLIIRQAPMTDDENAYLFSARLLQSFKLYWEGYAKELIPFLTNQFLVVKELAFSQYYPGFPALLALGLSLGAVNLVNPILAGLGVLITYRLVREISGSKSTAFIAAGLLSLSPCYLLTSATLLPHTASLFFAALFVLMVYRTIRHFRLFTSITAGLAWGFLLFTRPLTAALFGLVGAVMILGDFRALKERLKPAVAVAGIAGVFCLLFLAYNHLLTGDCFKTTYKAFVEFGGFPIYFSANQFTSGGWLSLLVFPFLRMNFWAFGWVFSFLFVFFCPAGTLRRLGLGVTLGLWLVHLPWPSVGVNLTGAAHYFEVLPFVAMLTAAGLVQLVKNAGRPIPELALSFALLSGLIALGVFFPWAIRNLNDLATTNLAPYETELQVRPPAIIFASLGPPKQNEESSKPNTWTFYRKNNRPDLSDDILWLNDLNEANDAAMRMFPERRAYHLRRISDASGETAFSLEEIPRPERQK